MRISSVWVVHCLSAVSSVCHCLLHWCELAQIQRQLHKTLSLSDWIVHYRKSPDRSRVPDKCWVPDTGRGSRQIVLIEAGGFYPGIYGIHKDNCFTAVIDSQWSLIHSDHWFTKIIDLQWSFIRHDHLFTMIIDSQWSLIHKDHWLLFVSKHIVACRYTG